MPKISKQFVFILLLCTLSSILVQSKDIGKFAVLTDIHQDKYYKINSNNLKYCHDGIGTCQRFGTPFDITDCDTPIETVDGIFNWWKGQIEDKTQQLDFVLWLGDSSRHLQKHDIHPLEPTELYESIIDISNKMKKSFVDQDDTIKIVPIIGNNDYYPKNKFPEEGKNQEIIENLAKAYSKFLTPSELADFKKGGYYQKEISATLGVIVLNTNTIDLKNKIIGDCDDNTEGDRQFKYIEKILQAEMEKVDKKRFILAGHKSPNSNYLKPKCLRRYQDLSFKYKDLIIAHYYGHEHSDQFDFIFKGADLDNTYKILDCNDAIGIINVAPGVAASFNPSTRIVEYSLTTPHSISKYSQYMVDAQKCSQTGVFQVQLEYEFPSFYNYNEHNIASYCNVYKSLYQDAGSDNARKFQKAIYVSQKTQMSCIPTQYFDATDLICKKCSVDNCFKCDKDSTKCEKCKTLYTWNALTQKCEKKIDSKLKGNYGVLTDLHLQMYYKQNSDVSKHCMESTGDAQKFGTQGWSCDTPIQTIENMFSWWQDQLVKKTKEIDFILMLGDTARHDWIDSSEALLRTEDELFSNVASISKLSYDTFANQDVVVIPSIGNNDYVPHDLFSPQHNNYILQQLNSNYKKFLNPEEISTFLQGGYYAKQISDQLTIMVMNTNIFKAKNSWVNDCDVQGSAGDLQFSWMEKLLQASLAAEKKTYYLIVGHEPPAIANYDQFKYFKTQCQIRYNALAEKYQSIIVGHQFGHEHSDDFYLLQKNQPTQLKHLRKEQDLTINCKDVTGIINVIPSVSPSYNPSTRVVKYSTIAPHKLLGYEQYFVDILKVNDKDKLGIDDVQLEYTFPEFFDMNYSIESYCNLYNTIINDKTGVLATKYKRIQSVSSSSIVCQPSYFLNQNYICEKCMDHCSKCTQKAICILCEDKYIFNTKSQKCTKSGKVLKAFLLFTLLYWIALIF